MQTLFHALEKCYILISPNCIAFCQFVHLLKYMQITWPLYGVRVHFRNIYIYAHIWISKEINCKYHGWTGNKFNESMVRKISILIALMTSKMYFCTEKVIQMAIWNTYTQTSCKECYPVRPRFLPFIWITFLLHFGRIEKLTARMSRQVFITVLQHVLK